MSILRKKLVAIGDSSSGVACLLTVFRTGKFPTFEPTVFEDCVLDLEIDGQCVEIVLSDMSFGHDDYSGIRFMLFQDADAIIVCFSVGCMQSLENVSLKWSPEIDQFCPNTPLLLVGNNKEMRTSDTRSPDIVQPDIVQPEVGRSVAVRIGAFCYLECSARTTEGVNEVLKQAARVALYGKKPDIALHGKKADKVYKKCRIF